MLRETCVYSELYGPLLSLRSNWVIRRVEIAVSLILHSLPSKEEMIAY